MSEELLPCPFCGGDAEVGYDGFVAPDYRVCCKISDVKVFGENELSAIEKWNRRTSFNTGDSQDE